jgi:hypothetical protein
MASFKNGDTDQAIVLLQKAWDELPEPKTEIPESYLIARSLIFVLSLQCKTVKISTPCHFL